MAWFGEKQAQSLGYDLLANAFIDWLKNGSADRRPLVMGILNVTPDSFSDGGQFFDIQRAANHAAQMIHDGADLIDIGGESTRPGARPVDPDEQMRRTIPVIESIRQQFDTTLSIDTTSSAVAAAALDAGASIINDVSAGRDDAATLPLAAARVAPIILMHRRGTSATMQNDPRYADVVTEVISFLQQSRDAARSAGVGDDKILLDPGIGFGKTTEHDLALLRNVDRLRDLGCPVVVGASRKKFIGKLTGETDPAGRTTGSIATAVWSVARGADIVRVHDVFQTVQAVKVAKEFRQW